MQDNRVEEQRVECQNDGISEYEEENNGWVFFFMSHDLTMFLKSCHKKGNKMARLFAVGEVSGLSLVLTASY